MKVTAVAIRVALFTLILTGVVYPLAMTGLAQALFPVKANGSLITDEKGTLVGSELIGQKFTKPAYLQGRPSAAGADGYDGNASGGSNFGVTSQKLQDRVAADRARLILLDPEAPGPIPTDLLTASASGLDPHISPEAARWQVPRIASARKVSVARIAEVIDRNVEGRELGFLGEPRVNVLLVNLALDRQFGRP
jgi:potassium-transporting ATPase KdpC subunit